RIKRRTRVDGQRVWSRGVVHKLDDEGPASLPAYASEPSRRLADKRNAVTLAVPVKNLNGLPAVPGKKNIGPSPLAVTVPTATMAAATVGRHRGRRPEPPAQPSPVIAAIANAITNSEAGHCLPHANRLRRLKPGQTARLRPDTCRPQQRDRYMHRRRAGARG